LYRTSTDEIYFQGQLGFLGVFIQDEFTLPGGKFRLTGGIRTDLARFRNGSQEVRDPSSKTGFPEGFTEEFETNLWYAVSPKLSLQYRLSPGKSVYLSAGTGFNPPKIEDLVRSGKIRKGFRLANPELLPERLANIEAGFKGGIAKDLFLSTALYHSEGNDFHYLAATGDTLESGGGSPRPVYRRENISRVSISGFELSLDYLIISSLSVQASYSYNHSIIKSYPDPAPGLEGKMLAEVPPHLFYAGITWRSRLLGALLECSYTDAQYADDLNQVRLEEYFLLNARIQLNPFERIRVYLNCQNILDNQFIDRKNKLSPGRYFSGGIKIFI
jgi:outer membrane receptor protein involved in Fe transport